MSKNFLNASKLIIGAQNIEQTNSNGVVTTNNGAYSNVSINVVPAYTIQGYTAVNGEKEGNQPLLLEDKTNGYNYYIKSNSTGFFRFFANPKDNYMLENTENSAGAIPIDPNGSTGGVTLNVNINTITFKTSSILDGNSWYVNINGPSGFSYTSSLTTGQTIEIETLGGGSYSYNIGVPNGWEANPANGQFNISNTHVIDIDFTPTSTYTVTFSSEGTNSGDPWAISVNGYTKQTTGTSISFSEPDGQFSWYVEDATVSTSYGSATYVWSGSPDSGTFSINGASPASISIKLTLDEVIENSNSGGGGGGGGTGCVNASTEILMANFTYMKASSILPGDYVLSYNLTTHQYQPEEIQTAYMSSHSTQYTINGILQTSPYQPILTKNGYVQAENLTTKMFIYNAFTGTFEKVHNITVSSGNFTMYDFQIPPAYDFIAWEYVVYDLTIKP
ncbi:MAG: Hint domain-containing protein [Thermoplasmataceae archaeon]